MHAKPLLFVVLSRFPYPLEKGDKLRAFNQLKGLSEEFSIILCCMTESTVAQQHYEEVKQYCSEIHLFRLGKAGLLLQAFLALFSKKPFQVAYFFRYAHARKIRRLLEEKQPSHIFCQLLRMAEYVKDYHHCAKTIDYMDALSKGMERRIFTEPWYRRWFYRMEYKRLSLYERGIFDYFEHKVIISAQDRQFILHPKRNEIVIIPNGVDEAFFQTPEREKRYDLLFTGNFSYPPNVEAAIFLAKEILPKLRKKGLDLNLLLSGASPHAKVKALASDTIHVTGWVEDIRESYAQSRIFVAPMFIGTGLQNKLLEAMAAGLPCITTHLANNALGGTDRQNILLAEQADEFVEKIMLCCSDSAIFGIISNNGCAYVRTHYSWDSQNNRLLMLLKTV